MDVSKTKLTSITVMLFLLTCFEYVRHRYLCPVLLEIVFPSCYSLINNTYPLQICMSITFLVFFFQYGRTESRVFCMLGKPGTAELYHQPCSKTTCYYSLTHYFYEMALGWYKNSFCGSMYMCLDLKILLPPCSSPIGMDLCMDLGLLTVPRR